VALVEREQIDAGARIGRGEAGQPLARAMRPVEHARRLAGAVREPDRAGHRRRDRVAAALRDDLDLVPARLQPDPGGEAGDACADDGDAHAPIVAQLAAARRPAFAVPSRMPALTIALLTVAALAAGTVDAIAGGGGLITVPALLAAGLPPHAALATNKGQSVWGSGAAMLTFWRHGRLDLAKARVTFPLGLLGAIGGTAAVLAVSPDALRPIAIAL